jgi:threonine dehydrogenase-like Zn-dependent dehydrogenase
MHALNKARLKPGETVAVFGVGGLGLSAIQLAKAFGAGEVFAVDIKPAKLAMAKELGAIAINAAGVDAVIELRQLTQGRGVDVAVELIGLPATMRQTVQSLAIKGRAALVGITDKTFEIAPYEEVLNKEAEIIGVSDHLASELPLLIEWVRQGKVNLSNIVTRTIPLDPNAINETLDGLEEFGDDGRVVIKPELSL